VQIDLDYAPQSRQALLHGTVANQIFYGGAAGGGKSHALRWDAIAFCLENPGCDAYLFRRTLGELQDNHIRKIRNEIPSVLGEYKTNEQRFVFYNGAGINFCYCEKEQDVHRYQGAEMHWLGVDEASHLTEYQLTYLRGRVRLGSWAPKTKLLPRIVFASNPGGPGHTFLKKTFIDGSVPEVLFRDKTMADPKNPDDQGWLSVFIPAKMRDNKYLSSNYAGQFSALPPELARALTEGDWDAVVGAALHNLSREKHQLRPFDPPKWWTRFMCIDWGTAKPFSVGWYCVADQDTHLAAKNGWDGVDIPAGAVIRYREWYGWDGKADKGKRMPAAVVAQKILEREDGEVIDYRVGDTGMWAQHDGPSPQENMSTATDGRFRMRQSKKDRKAMYAEILARLSGSEDYGESGEESLPMFYVTANCEHFWRTVPMLVLDEFDPDKGPNSKQEDHVYDEVGYALRSRPFVTTQRDREHEKWETEYKRYARNSVDPYATV